MSGEDCFFSPQQRLDDFADLIDISMPLMRTTVRLDERLLAEAKKYAAETGRTLTAVLEDALRETLARRRTRTGRKPVRLKTVKGDRVRRGVDLDDTASLLDLMES